MVSILQSFPWEVSILYIYTFTYNIYTWGEGGTIHTQSPDFPWEVLFFIVGGGKILTQSQNLRLGLPLNEKMNL